MSAHPPASHRAGEPTVRGLRTALDAAGAMGERLHAVVLVEGASDLNALHAAAAVLGRDLGSEGILVVSMGGITNLGHFLRGLDPGGETTSIHTALLCDEGEEAYVRSVLARLRRDVRVAVCRADLEEEVVRALGADRAERVVVAEGDLRALRSLKGQPEWRDRPAAEQLRRFLGSGSGRKIRYATRLTEALAPGEVPGPLVAALEPDQRRSSR